MNVLSLFDGMSCARIALKELGIKVDKYFASEIDKYAIAQTRLNFPDTIQLGDVTQVDGYALPKIDLLVAARRAKVSVLQASSLTSKTHEVSCSLNTSEY